MSIYFDGIEYPTQWQANDAKATARHHALGLSGANAGQLAAQRRADARRSLRARLRHQEALKAAQAEPYDPELSQGLQALAHKALLLANVEPNLEPYQTLGDLRRKVARINASLAEWLTEPDTESEVG